MKLHFSGIFIFIFYSLWALGAAYLFKGNEIFDLQGKTASEFDQESNAWVLTNNLTANKSSVCNGLYLLGGYQVVGNGTTITRSYTIPQPHNSLYITAFFSLLDDWSIFDMIRFQVKSPSMVHFDKEIISLVVANSLLTTKVNVCGGITTDNTDILVLIQSPHTGNQVDFVISTMLDTATPRRYLGLRNFTVVLSNNTVSTPEHCYFDDTFGNSGAFTNCDCGVTRYSYGLMCRDCPIGCFTCSSAPECMACQPNYFYNGATCVTCDPSCATCSGEKPNQCLSCKTGFYLAPGNTCNATCPAPYVVQLKETDRYCNFPCDFSSFYYDNTSCKSSCSSPFSPVVYNTGEKFCNFVCQPNQYLYTNNNTCLSSCPSPWIARIEGGIYMYCDHPCNSLSPDQTTSYLYWNASCLPSCLSPLQIQIQSNVLTCNYSCLDTQYLYPTEECLGNCSAPLKSKIEGGKNFCFNPCVSSNQSLFDDGFCISSCPSPLISKSNRYGQFCSRPCPASEQYYNSETKKCQSTCPEGEYSLTFPLALYPSCSPISKQIQQINSVNRVSGTMTDVGLTTAGLVAPSDPGSVSAGMLAKMLQYIKYINISYPEKLEATFKMHNSTLGPFGIGPHLPDSFYKRFTFREVPVRFSKFRVHSSFLINFWDSLILLLIIISIMTLFQMLVLVVSKYSKSSSINSLVKKINSIFQNFFLMQFYNSYGDILLFFGIEARASELKVLESVISLMLSILFVFLGIFILFLHIKVLREYQNLKLNKSNSNLSDDFSKTHQGTQLFYLKFKDSSYTDQGFLLFYVIRASMFNLVLSLGSNYPFIQVVVIFLMTCLIVIYLTIKRPFKSVINLLQQLTCEAIFLVVNSCVLAIAIIEKSSNNSDNLNVKDSLGDVIIFASLIFGFVPLVFLVAKVIQAVWEFIQSRKKKNTGIKDGRDNIPRTVQARPALGKNGNIEMKRENDESEVTLDNSYLDLKYNQTSSFNQIERSNSTVFMLSNDILKQKRDADRERFRKNTDGVYTKKKHNTLDVGRIDQYDNANERGKFKKSNDLMQDIENRSRPKLYFKNKTGYA